jgi:hypothetical protein
MGQNYLVQVDVMYSSEYEKRDRSAALRKYRVAEIKRLTNECVSISKIVKMLELPYSLAKSLST